MATNRQSVREVVRSGRAGSKTACHSEEILAAPGVMASGARSDEAAPLTLNVYGDKTTSRMLMDGAVPPLHLHIQAPFPQKGST